MNEIMSAILPMAVLFAIFYFLIILPQQKQQKKHKEMLSNLKRGDKILTSGGLIATINKVEEEFLKIELADNCIIKLQREFVAKNLNDEK